jgi:hypothetical protein
MKTIQFLLFFAGFVARICAQQFEILYDHEGFSNDGGSIIKIGGGYFTTHAATDPNLGLTTLVATFDDQAFLVWDTSLTSYAEKFSQSSLNGNIFFDVEESNSWVIGNYGIQGEATVIPFLKLYNNNGQLLQTKLLDTLDQYSPNIFGGIRTLEGIYLSCRNNAVNDPNEILIVKCSLDGEYEWHQTYDAGVQFHPKCIVDVGDGFVVAGWRYATQFDLSDLNGQQYIRKFNYQGESQWISTMAHGDNMNLGAVGIVQLDNGNYLFAGTKYIEGYSIQPLIGELNSDTGDTLWTRVYFESEDYDPNNLNDFNSLNRIHGFKKLESGGFLGVGECRHEIISGAEDDPLDNAAFLMKLDDEYNLLWKRIYVPEGYAELEQSQAQCQLNDFVENDDGSITALGRVYMYTGSGPQGGYIQDSYLIRVDSMGCLITGCAVGIEEFEPSDNMFVYPNPANGPVTILLPYKDNWNIDIFDAHGKLVHNQILQQNNKAELETNRFLSGIYLLRVKNKTKLFHSKLFIQN